ncbi:acyl-CoA thioesterase [Ferrimonas balearica]|uniref:acyl-CoA thioesterase n=1 Tax=Ferrimonas balearica TaxID=44012 RepID=UPI001F4812EC|nr:thioesterase family protein [Ferrimonas balearica]MBY6017750.1 acyl-CoA thioesterase [Halomonas denitrificans]MBY6094108.1 acyl-CoA thioesterase [Ferrimonas balearica]
MESFQQAFPFSAPVRVAWGEMDALQHVNNAVYFRYFETARLAFFEQLNLMGELQQMGIAPVLSDTRARYRRPVTYPDQLRVGARITHIGEDRFTMEYGVFSEQQQALTTLGEAEIVMFNVAAKRKCAIPDVLKQQLQRYVTTPECV